MEVDEKVRKGEFCQYCGKHCKTRKSLSVHEKKCLERSQTVLAKFELSDRKICPLCDCELGEEGLSHLVMDHQGNYLYFIRK